MRKTIATIFIAALSAAALAGCSHSAPPAATAPASSTTEAASQPASTTTEEAAQASTSAEAAAQASTSAEKPTIHLKGGDTGLPNPFLVTKRGPSTGKMQILYDSLIEKGEKGIIPWLATDWEVSKDGLTYTYHLVKNAVWQDGEPLTADDVAFSFNYYREHMPTDTSLNVDGNYIVSAATATDPYTVQLTMDKYYATAETALGYARIIPKHIWENVDDPKSFTGAQATIGSGPYKLESYDPTQGTYRFVENGDFWGPKPTASAIEWIPVGDPVMAFENGQIDLLNAPADLLGKYEKDPQYKILNTYSWHSYRLMFNMEKSKDLQNIKLRQAMAYAIDDKDLIDKVARGQGVESSKGYVPAGNPWYDPDVETYSYDPQKAKELLDNKTYSFTLLTDQSSDSQGIGELIKAYLGKVGINITIQSVDKKVRDNAIKTGDYTIMLNYFGGMGVDPDYLRTIFTGNNTVKGWSDPRFDELASAQAVELDKDTRKKMLDEMQEIIADQLPMLTLYGPMDNFVYRPGTFDGWKFRYDQSKVDQNKLSYVASVTEP